MFQALLEKLAIALEVRGIAYMVIGGQAVLLYGEPRFTRDIDITLGLDAEGADQGVALARDLGLTIRVEQPRKFVHDTMVLPCEERSSGIRVDFVFSHSEYERVALARVRRERIGKATVAYASLEDLVIQKLVAGRPRDLEDARIVLLKNPDYDRAYVEKWLSQFEPVVEQPLGEILKTLVTKKPRNG